jgi:hypothetical protein
MRALVVDLCALDDWCVGHCARDDRLDDAATRLPKVIALVGFPDEVSFEFVEVVVEVRRGVVLD